MALLKPIAGRLSDMIGRMLPILFGMIVISISSTGLGFSSGIFLMMLSLIFLSAGVSLVFSSTKPLASEIMGPRMHGTAIGTTETIKDIGQTLGPVIAGAMIGHLGF